MCHLSLPEEQSCEGLLWPVPWVEMDSGWSMCNWEVASSISPFLCLSFFLKQLPLLSEHVATAFLSSLKE